jgi:hypothetical protein
MPEPMPKLPQPEVHFHHQKANLFRVVHTDGVWCSMGAHEDLHLVFFSERLAIPNETYYAVRPDGELGNENTSKRTGKDGYVREMEVDVVLDWKSIISLHSYLTTYIESKNKPATLPKTPFKK